MSGAAPREDSCRCYALRRPSAIFGACLDITLRAVSWRMSAAYGIAISTSKQTCKHKRTVVISGNAMLCAGWESSSDSTEKDARGEFANLEQMHDAVRYPLTIFINIDSKETHSKLCPESIASQTICFAVRPGRRGGCRPGGRVQSTDEKEEPGLVCI